VDGYVPAVRPTTVLSGHKETLMKRTLVTIAGATALATLVLGSPVAAATQPVAGCGKGNPMQTVEDGLAMIDWRIYTPEERAELEPLFRELVDVNGDGWLCVKQFGPSVGISNKWTDRQFADYVVTRLTDNKAKGQLG
jgi:hypothetical protein